MVGPPNQRHFLGVEVLTSSSSQRRRSGNVSGDGACNPSADLLNTLEKSVEDLRALITCRVCIRPMYEPYTIACGHTFCYSCLAQWFSNHNANKTCPDCRTRVIQQPAPAYVLREMTQLFITRAELMPFDETIQDHKKNSEEEANLIRRDRLNTDGKNGGLFRGCFKQSGSFIVHRPIRDDEDGVIRCPNCAWELEDGYCNACEVGYDTDGVPYEAESLDWSEGDDDSDTSLRLYGNRLRHLASDEDNDLAALVEMGDTEGDISLDGDGNSVHTESEGHMGRGDFAFARSAAQGLLNRPSRRYFNPGQISRRRYTSSMLSDDESGHAGIGPERGYEEGRDDQSNPSVQGDESDDEIGSLDELAVQDDIKYEDDTDEEPPTYNFSPILGGGVSDDEIQDNYGSESGHEPETSISNSDDEETSNGYIRDHHNDNGNGGYSEGETDTTIGQRHRPHERFRQASDRQQPIQLTTSESEAEISPRRAPRTERVALHQFRSAHRVSSRVRNRPIIEHSDSDQPARGRKRRIVINEPSSDEPNSDVEPNRRHKRNRNLSRQNIVEV